MRIRILGAYGGTLPGFRMTCFLVNDQVVLDAGSIASSLELEDQLRIRHVVITHSHSDHINSLPFFIENVFGRFKGIVRIHSLEPAISAIQRHLFNNAIWPDFASIPDQVLPMMAFQPTPIMKTIPIANLSITMVPVNHIVPTVGLVVEEEASAIVISGDTGPTQSLWAVANGYKDGDIKAIFIETSFPNRMQSLADISRHLTPQQLPEELAKCRHQCPVYVYHIKPPLLDEVKEEIAALDAPRIQLLEQDKTYIF